MNVEGRQTGNSDERKWGNLGKRMRRDVGQSQNLSRMGKNGSQESGTVEEGSKVGWRERVIFEKAEAGVCGERSPQVVRGPEGEPQGVLCSVAALGPCFEATWP